MPGSLVGETHPPARKATNVHSLEIVLGLIVLSAAVAAIADRLSAPAPSLLVLAGLGVGLLPGVPEIQLDPAAVALIVLPPLLYAAGNDLSMTDLRTVIRPVAALAVGLVATTALAVAMLTRTVLPHVSWAPALVLGTVLASTDPVALAALARRLELPPRVLALVQGESLLNDATSLLLFRLAVAAAAGSTTGAGALGLRFAQLALGGLAIGLIIGALETWLRRRTDDPVMETVLALVTPYAAYVAAESLSASGVAAVITAALFLSERRGTLSRAPSRLRISGVYDVVVFLLESTVFAVIGLQLPTLVRALPQGEGPWVVGITVTTATLLAARLLWVLPAVMLRQNRTLGEAPHWRALTVISWAGTRGVLPLTAVLTLPLVTARGTPFPHRDLLLLLTAGTVTVSLVVQGLTLAPMVRRLGVTADPRERARQETLGRHAAALAATLRLEELADLDAAPPAVIERLRVGLAHRLERTRAPLEQDLTPDQHPAAGATYSQLRRDLLATEGTRLRELRDSGVITEAVRRGLQRALDLEEASLSGQ